MIENTYYVTPRIKFHWFSGCDSNTSDILHKVGTGEFKSSEIFVIKTTDIFIRGWYLKHPYSLSHNICF